MFKLNINLLKNLHKFLIKRFPILEHENNFILVDPINYKSITSYFSLYLFNKNNRQYLTIHFNQFLYQYLNLIIDSIEIFFNKLSKSYNITTNQYTIQYNRNDRVIHLLSEIYYIVVVILYKMPFI